MKANLQQEYLEVNYYGKNESGKRKRIYESY